MLKFPAPFQQAAGKKQPRVSALWPPLALASLSPGCRGLGASRAHHHLPAPEPASPFACGFQANVSHLEHSSVGALLTVCFRLEAYTGCGGDSEEGLLIALTAPSGFPPPKKRCGGRGQIEPGNYSPPHVGWPLVPFSMTVAGWACFG